MGRAKFGTYQNAWQPPKYTVDDNGKVVGGWSPAGRHNWGRWGDADQRGASNLIGPEQTLHAASLVKRGAVFSLTLPISPEMPLWPGREKPKLTVQVSGSDVVVGSPWSANICNHVHLDDSITMPLQGATQWDGLAHIPVEDCFFNGYWAGTATSEGAKYVGIEHQRESFVGRGILLDLARTAGVDSLDQEHVVTTAELDHALEHAGVEVRQGDIVLIRTGYLSQYYAITDPQDKLDYFFNGCPGPGRDSIAWFDRYDIAAAATDTVGFEKMHAEDPERPFPLHRHLLCEMGITIGELWDLEALADDCARDGIYEFMLVAPPLNIPGAVGSPLNPIAIK